MRIHPINAIECAILHNRFSAMTLEQKSVAVASAIARIDSFARVELAQADDDFVTFRVGNYEVSVAQKAEPLAASGFNGCLPQPITKIMMPDAEERIASHSAHSFVSVSRSAANAAADGVDEDGEYAFGDFRDSKDAHKAMVLTYWVADALHRFNPASAIHWLPSDHLVSAQFFELAGQGKSLTPIFIRPYLFSSAGVIGEGSPVGLVANGSQYLLDRPVIFDEAAVSYEWMIQRSVQFIDTALHAQAVPADGAGFVPVKDELIEVMHREPAPASPRGSYGLVVRNAPQFGIAGGLNSVLQKAEQEPVKELRSPSDLDENDPVDFAIIQALKNRAKEMREQTKVPVEKDRRSGPRETHKVARFGRGRVFGKR